MFRNYKEIVSNEFYKNVFTLISATAAAQALAFIIYPVLTRVYLPEEHGIFSIYMSIIAITSIVSTGKYELAVLLPKSEKRSINLVSLSIFLTLIVSFLLLILVIFFGKSFSVILGNEDLRPWLYFVPLSTLFVSIFQTLSVWSNRHKRYRRMAGANMSQSVSNSLIKVSSSEIFANAGGLVIGTLVGQFVGIIGYLIDLFKNDRKILAEINRKEMFICMREYKLFPKFSMIHYLVNNFSTSMPVFAISAWFSLAETGVYSLAFLMVYRPINILTISFSHVFSQKVINNFNEGKEISGDVNRFIKRLIQIAVIPFIIAGIFGPVVFSWIFGREWAEAGRYMQILLPWMFCGYLASPLSFLPDMLAKQKDAMWIDIIKFIVRLLAIGAGVYFLNIYVMLICFSIVSTLVTAYSFYWYIRLAGTADKVSLRGKDRKPEIPVIDNQDALI